MKKKNKQTNKEEEEKKTTNITPEVSGVLGAACRSEIVEINQNISASSYKFLKTRRWQNYELRKKSETEGFFFHDYKTIVRKIFRIIRATHAPFLLHSSY